MKHPPLFEEKNKVRNEALFLPRKRRICVVFGFLGKQRICNIYLSCDLSASPVGTYRHQTLRIWVPKCLGYLRPVDSERLTLTQPLKGIKRYIWIGTDSLYWRRSKHFGTSTGHPARDRCRDRFRCLSCVKIARNAIYYNFLA